eukprot:CAMPEP_0195084514 /NCGR_PEP_ID=MMETSP0448-20130528/25185_1 /TAXON_ID=66468 /ORGANISM="Heterocapsa triquestra, Strain CCMP 448" /LENGTH=38 /DNA_ID= /DNA_START= /DNA_END= /DNA_ORIENTATION=
MTRRTTSRSRAVCGRVVSPLAGRATDQAHAGVKREGAD